MSTSPARVRDEPRAAPLVVASVPAGHSYVEHLAPLDGGGARRLPDPVPEPGAPAGQWWPPAMLEADWVRTHAVDLVHLHFGFDARTVAQLEEWVAVLRRRGTPLVYTLHDLRNPHFHEREGHDRHLDVLVPAADHLVTLTPGAAAEIARRWGREASVVPHPHVAPLDLVGRPREPRPTFRVGVHLKSLRASMDPAPVLAVLAEVVPDLPGGVLQVDVHDDVMTGESPRADPALVAQVEALAEQGRIDLRVHGFLDDAALWEHLASLDVSVLPYRFGTHSGWLEACRDLGTTVVAPTCGYFAEQGPVLDFGLDEDHFDADSLAGAVRRAHAERPRLGATREERVAQRIAVADAHEGIYRRLVGS